MEHEWRAARERERSLSIFLGQLNTEMFAAGFGFLQKTFGYIMMVHVDGTSVHVGVDLTFGID
jgi:hypothetical protein